MVLMSDLTHAEKARALSLAADVLDYVWSSTKDNERAEAEDLGLEEQFDWYAEGYVGAIAELRAASGLLGEYAKGTLVTRQVDGL